MYITDLVIQAVNTMRPLRPPPFTAAQQRIINNARCSDLSALAFVGDAYFGYIILYLLQTRYPGRPNIFYTTAKRALGENSVFTAIMFKAVARIAEPYPEPQDKSYADLFEALIGVVVVDEEGSIIFPWIVDSLMPLIEVARTTYFERAQEIIRGPLLFPTPSPLPKRRRSDNDLDDTPPSTPPRKRTTMMRRHTTSPPNLSRTMSNYSMNIPKTKFPLLLRLPASDASSTHELGSAENPIEVADSP